MSGPVRSLLVASAGGPDDPPGSLAQALSAGPCDAVVLDLLRDVAPDEAAGQEVRLLRELEPVLASLWDSGVQLVAAASRDPGRTARTLRELAGRLGLDLAVAHVEPGITRDEDGAATDGRALLGGWGVAGALRAGAQVVVTSHLDPTALTVGVAAAHFGWLRSDVAALAGAAATGLVLGAGTRATAGRALITAEIAEDGTALLSPTTVDRVTGCLLEAAGGARTEAADVLVDLTRSRVEQIGGDLVRLSGVRGEPPTGRLVAVVPAESVVRDTAVLALPGEPAAAAEQVLTLLGELVGPVTGDLERTDRPDPTLVAQSAALLHVHAHGSEPGRFAAALRAVVHAGPPGTVLLVPPAGPRRSPRTWRATVDADAVDHVVVAADGRATEVRADPLTRPPRVATIAPPPLPGGPTTAAPLGSVVGARSRARGEDAVIALWGLVPGAGRWLAAWLTADRVGALLPEAAGRAVRLDPVPGLDGLCLTVEGLLDDGQGLAVRANQVGEHLRARVVDVPRALLADP